MIGDEYHVASYVVSNRPEDAARVAESLVAISGLQVHAVARRPSGQRRPEGRDAALEIAARAADAVGVVDRAGPHVGSHKRRQQRLREDRRGDALGRVGYEAS